MSRNRLGVELLEDRCVPSATQLVTTLYADFLDRLPAQAELTNDVNLLSSGTSQAALASVFAASPEFLDGQTSHDYETLLGREPSANDLQFWRSQLQSGLSFQQETVNILATDEYFARQGGTAQDWLNGVYRDVLGRAPDAGGTSAFLSLAGQAAGRAQAASAIVFSGEAAADEVNQAYMLLLQRPADPQGLSYWTGQLSAGMPVTQLLVNLAGSPEYAAVAADPPALPVSPPPGVISAGSPLLTLDLPPLDINLLGLEVQTSGPIQVVVSAQTGQGELLGNVLTDAANLLNLQGVNNALNSVLGSVVALVNSASLNVSGVNNVSGPLSTAATATTPVLDLFVAPVHLNLLGALVDTSPIHLTITAQSGPGLVLGNLVTDLANLFNPPLPSSLDLNTINTQLQNLLSELNAQIPGIGSSTTTPPTIAAGSEQVLSLTVPPINVNLLGLILQTTQIQVNANALTGNGDLLGNVLTDLLNTLGATPQNLTDLNTNLNALLAKVVGVLNASSLILPSNALVSLSQVLQTLASPTLVDSSGTASAPILNLAIASSDGTTPPVNVNLLGLQVTTSNIQAQLLAQTGDGQILGNLLYNVANLLNPGGTLDLLSILNELGV